MREKILAIIRRNCEQQMFEANTAIIISEQIHISRNETASLLHALTTQKKVIKIGARPSFLTEILWSRNTVCRFQTTAINLSNF